MALAIARVGVLVSLVAIALADRSGRRRSSWSRLVGACAANAVTAIAPTFEVFTGAQLVQRGLGEHRARSSPASPPSRTLPRVPAPSRTGMFALALGPGFALAVILLPLADLGDYGWRISFAVSAALVLLVPMLAATSTRPAATEQLANRTDRPRRASARCSTATYGRAVPAPRSRRVPHQRVQRAVVAAHATAT